MYNDILSKNAEKYSAEKKENRHDDEDKFVELNNITEGSEKIEEIADKIYSDCRNLMRNTRYIIVPLTDISEHIHKMGISICYWDELKYNDEYILEDIRHEYKRAINELNQASLDKLMDNYKLNLSKLKENFDLLEKIIQENKDDD